ncbi:helix-turn-helix domain-containing protein [Azotobacter vinelandii]
MATSSSPPASDSFPADPSHYGWRIAEEQKRLGFTQAEFAALLAIGIQKMRAIKQGSQRSLTMQLMVYLAVRGVNVNYVLFGRHTLF